MNPLKKGVATLRGYGNAFLRMLSPTRELDNSR